MVLRLEWAEEPGVKAHHQDGGADEDECVRRDQAAEHENQSEGDDQRLDRVVRHHDPQLRSGFAFLGIDPRALVIDFLSFPERISARDGRNLREVVIRRRARDAPLQRSRPPRIRAGDLAALSALEEIVDENQHRDREDHRARGGHPVVEIPALAGVVGVNATRHAKHSREVHREEREIHRDEREPEMNLAQLLIHQAPHDLGEIVIDACKDSHDRAAEQDVVEVRDDEVRVGLLQVCRRRRVHDPGDSTDREQADEADSEQHRRRVADGALRHRRDPVEDLDARRDRDEHRRQSEERVGNRPHPDGEHVVRPHSEA